MWTLTRTVYVVRNDDDDDDDNDDIGLSGRLLPYIVDGVLLQKMILKIFLDFLPLSNDSYQIVSLEWIKVLSLIGLRIPVQWLCLFPFFVKNFPLELC